MMSLALGSVSLHCLPSSRASEKNASPLGVRRTANRRRTLARSPKSTIVMAAPSSPSSSSSSETTEIASTTTSSSDSAATATATAATTLAASFFSSGDKRPILLYDAKCNLCNGGVDVARALDGRGDAARLRFAALQSPAGRALLVSAAGRSPDDISSVVLVESPTKAFVRSEAVVRAAEVIGAPAAVLAAALAGPIPLTARDKAYDVVADNRYNVFGKSSEERWTREGEPEGRFLVE